MDLLDSQVQWDLLEVLVPWDHKDLQVQLVNQAGLVHLVCPVDLDQQEVQALQEYLELMVYREIQEQLVK